MCSLSSFSAARAFPYSPRRTTQNRPARQPQEVAPVTISKPSRPTALGGRRQLRARLATAVGEEWQPYVDGRGRGRAMAGLGVDEPWGWTLHYGAGIVGRLRLGVGSGGTSGGRVWTGTGSRVIGFVAGLPCPVRRSRGQQLRLRRGSELRRAQLKRAVLDGNHVRGTSSTTRAHATPAHARTDRARVAPSGAARRRPPDPGALGPTGREPSATLRRRPSTGSVAAGERDGARVGAAVHRPERARRWHSPHVASGTARTRPALASASAVAVRAYRGACRVRRRRSGDARARRRRLRASRWHIPAARTGFLPPRTSFMRRVRPLSGTRRPGAGHAPLRRAWVAGRRRTRVFGADSAQSAPGAAERPHPIA